VHRSAGFYRVPFDTSRVPAGLHDPVSLHQAGDVAVSSGQAVTAWVGVVEDARRVPVARAGAAADGCTRNLSIAVPDAADEFAPRSPSAMAILWREPAVCNQILTDERMRPWKERAARCCLGSSVALPIRRSAVFGGTLNLYFGETGVVDAKLTAVGDKIVSEPGQALDLADRDAARQLAEKVGRERDLQPSSVVETALEAIVTLNSRFEVVLFNDAAAHTFGVPSGEASGASIDLFIEAGMRATLKEYVQWYSAHGA
jgi:PAS domain-containing protein